MRFISVASFLAFVSGAFSRTFTVYNSCSFTIWPAIFTDLTVATNVPNFTTGWEAAANSSVSFTVPDNWKSGRIWGRRDCNFSTNPGPNSCLDGGCNGGLVCDPHTGTGVPPATVAEWTLQGDGNNDFYDVSLVDGYNLPLSVTNNVGCPVADCPVDLGPNCPAPIQGPFEPSGFPVGCKSACEANLDGNPSNSSNCCTGSFASAATCPPSGVSYYSYFKGNCPNSYAYAFDESSGTALWTCNSGLNANYNVIFCPSNGTAPAIPATSDMSSSSAAPSSSQGSIKSSPATALVRTGSPSYLLVIMAFGVMMDGQFGYDSWILFIGL